MIHRRYVIPPLWALGLVSVLLCCASITPHRHLAIVLLRVPMWSPICAHNKKNDQPRQRIPPFPLFRFALDHRWLSPSPSRCIRSLVPSVRPSPLPWAAWPSPSLSHGHAGVCNTDRQRQRDRQVAQKDLPAWPGWHVVPASVTSVFGVMTQTDRQTGRQNHNQPFHTPTQPTETTDSQPARRTDVRPVGIFTHDTKGSDQEAQASNPWHAPARQQLVGFSQSGSQVATSMNHLQCI
mmetsp:Transcript_36577/g.104784  ORF Transcript_36577/g.104784 Transcript_36577/m.104784 type:complete len:237 (-) Transcript_36577:1378-2088(-)